MAAARLDRKQTSPLSRITSLKTGEPVVEQGVDVACCNTMPQGPSRQSKDPASRNGGKVMHPGQLHCRLQFAILYEIYVNGILRPESSVIGSGRILAYTVVEGSNTFEVFAVDSASNRSAPTSVAL
jgi:hypothetical protein